MSNPPYLASLQLFPLSHQAVLFSPVSPSGSTATYPVSSPDPTYSTQPLSFSSVPSQISLAPSMLSLSSPQSTVLLTTSQPTTPLAVPDDCDDIGLLLRSVPQSCIRNFSPTRKYSICVNHFKANSSFKFPSRYFDCCNRSRQHKNFEENPWFVYSKV